MRMINSNRPEAADPWYSALYGVRTPSTSFEKMLVSPSPTNLFEDGQQGLGANTRLRFVLVEDTKFENEKGPQIDLTWGPF